MLKRLPPPHLKRTSIVRLMICKQCLSTRSCYKVFTRRVTVHEQDKHLEILKSKRIFSYLKLCLRHCPNFISANAFLNCSHRKSYCDCVKKSNMY